jgi:hypothetical protein
MRAELHKMIMGPHFRMHTAKGNIKPQEVFDISDTLSETAGAYCEVVYSGLHRFLVIQFISVMPIGKGRSPGTFSRPHRRQRIPIRGGWVDVPERRIDIDPFLRPIGTCSF